MVGMLRKRRKMALNPFLISFIQGSIRHMLKCRAVESVEGQTEQTGSNQWCLAHLILPLNQGQLKE